MGDQDADLKRRAESRVGSILRDKWCLERLLGLGGMAAVYAATHRNGKVAAIKILHPEASLVPDVKARFLREGYLANKVRHSGAVSILDDDVDVDGTVFLVMELLEGETLDARWHRLNRLDWQATFVVADKVLDVLIAAHDKEIVHRDLKPGNVFICGDGTVKVLDFGIARLQNMRQLKGDTGGHLSLGTPGFMPHEQARGQWARVDATSDLWALGATMFAVRAGRYVHEAATVNEQLLAAMTEPAPPLQSIASDAPPEVAELVDRLLKFEKEQRFTDARSVRQALRDTYQKLAGQPIESAPTLSVPGVPRHRSVLPDAPTVAAAELDSLRLSSSRAVTGGESTTGGTKSPPTKRKKSLMVVALALAALGIASSLMLGRRSNDRPTPSETGNFSAPVPAQAIPPPAAAVTPPPSQTSSTSAEPIAAKAAPTPPKKSSSPDRERTHTPATESSVAHARAPAGQSAPPSETTSPPIRPSASPAEAGRPQTRASAGPPTPASVPRPAAEPSVDIFSRRK